ncbi:hypothetical protein GC170_19150 [bacterium]|nr:hypothetical protein [bacterium]
MKSQDSIEDDAVDDIIGHALGLIDFRPQRYFVETDAGSNDPRPCPERVARTRSQIGLLLNDGCEPHGSEPIRPPDDLRQRTLNRIREQKAMTLEFREPFVEKPRWRLADVAVAASVLCAAFLGSLPALKNGKATAANLACSSNLTQIWQGVEQYATTFNVYPNATVENRRLPIGATLALMRHTGHLPESVPLTCPGCSSRLQARELPHWNQLNQQSEQLLRDFSAMMAEVYAMHPGLKGQVGVRYLDRSMIESVKSVIPMAGDRPPVNGRTPLLQGNSPWHGGFGQNVIFADGHSAFIRGRSIRSLDRDIYSNRQGHCDAALDPFDIILVPAGACLNQD